MQNTRSQACFLCGLDPSLKVVSVFSFLIPSILTRTSSSIWLVPEQLPRSVLHIPGLYTTNQVKRLGTPPPHHHYGCPQGHITHEPHGKLYGTSFLGNFLSFIVGDYFRRQTHYFKLINQLNFPQPDRNSFPLSSPRSSFPQPPLSLPPFTPPSFQKANSSVLACSC